MVSTSRQMSPEERAREVEAAKLRIPARRKELSDVSDNFAASRSVEERLKGIMAKTDNEVEAVAKRPQQEKPGSLKDLTVDLKKFDEKLKKAGMDISAVSLGKGKDEKAKGKEIPKREIEKGRTKDEIKAQKPGKEDDMSKQGEDKKKEKEELTPEKQEQKMREMFSKIQLPSGMEIHQEGPSWVLVSKDGKQRTDVTDVMNTIDKFNRSVDAANEENRMHNAAQSGADKAVDKSKGEDMNQNPAMSHESKVATVSEALPGVTDTNGDKIFDEGDLKKIAETGIDFSNEMRHLDKALEEMAKRNKRNEEKADTVKMQQQQRMLDQARGGRS